MVAHELDTARAEEFGGQMVGMLNSAFIAVLTSVGHQTGLFDTMAELPPTTCEQVAVAAGLNERYVREWLAAMAAGKIVEYDAAGRTFRLPPEHAASLTRAAGPGNLAYFTQYVGEVSKVLPHLVECFREGGGVPYAEFTGFQELQRGETAPVFDATLIDITLPLVSGLVDRLRRGIDVADVGCGSGHAINLMARAFSASRLTGFDFSEEGLAAGRAEAAAWGLTNVRFVARDVAVLDETAAFDLITAFDTIHDQAQPRQVLRNVARALRPDGTFLMVDIAASSDLADNLDHPFAPFLYAASVLHCMTVSLAQGGEGLGTMWGEQQARQLLGEAGLTVADVHHLEDDPLNAYYVCTRA